MTIIATDKALFYGRPEVMFVSSSLPSLFERRVFALPDLPAAYLKGGPVASDQLPTTETADLEPDTVAFPHPQLIEHAREILRAYAVDPDETSQGEHAVAQLFPQLATCAVNAWKTYALQSLEPCLNAENSQMELHDFLRTQFELVFALAVLLDAESVLSLSQEALNRGEEDREPVRHEEV